ncbi:Fic family protein [Aestuariirhabdus litorea]|uniref:Cell filamentation protein Fic n=1 Tax=Aestuariirhabdus litorea TaxID=2528527 RepID=A0A3P3VJV5_9GAMM|nr:Fic family protein [Aestuariirhabdus litorea]RRJ82607.1 cell filamentation protein Fic [Aestuariirhabdus litorea]RWW92766.1 cell filamentation protein Fic [Endozoicomonadaceae bacterium GTF-13]
MTLKNIKPDKQMALMLAKNQLAELVHDAVALEGILFTLPEIQMLMNGHTVGGHPLSDQQIAINQANAWGYLFDAIENGWFDLSARFAKDLHSIAGKEEALTWGDYRHGGVTISGTEYLPPEPEELPALFELMVAGALQISDPYDRAIFVFLEMARSQFFYDVNKRMGRFMMNGVLLANGYPVINVPAKRREEFDALMLTFYGSGYKAPMGAFLRSCIDPRAVGVMSGCPNGS